MQPTSPIHKKLGARIKKLRKEKNMTQEDLAFEIKVDRSYMGFLERGERNPTLKTIISVSKALKTPLSELFSNL